MDIVERLFLTMKNKKITQEDLAKVLNTKQPTISHWRTGTKIPIEYIEPICKLLEISADYLIIGEENKDYISPEEMKLVEQYRKILPEGQKNIKKYIEFELYKQENK